MLFFFFSKLQFKVVGKQNKYLFGKKKIKEVCQIRLVTFQVKV